MKRSVLAVDCQSYGKWAGNY